LSKYRVRRLFQPLVSSLALLFARIGLRPNHVTVASLITTVFASVSLALDLPLMYGILLFTSGLLDGVDGALARLTGSSSSWGGFLDSLSDRYADVIAIIGFLFWKEMKGFKLLFPVELWVALAVAGFLMVSYVRSEGEGVGVPLDVGLAARSERLLILSTSSMLYPLAWFSPCLGLIVCCVLAHLTAIYRFVFASVKLKLRYEDSS